eukprot:scaffold169012_cov25-Tisochrysis_lutea.AAC.1
MQQWAKEPACHARTNPLALACHCASLRLFRSGCDPPTPHSDGKVTTKREERRQGTRHSLLQQGPAPPSPHEWAGGTLRAADLVDY